LTNCAPEHVAGITVDDVVVPTSALHNPVAVSNHADPLPAGGVPGGLLVCPVITKGPSPDVSTIWRHAPLALQYHRFAGVAETSRNHVCPGVHAPDGAPLPVVTFMLLEPLSATHVFALEQPNNAAVVGGFSSKKTSPPVHAGGKDTPTFTGLVDTADEKSTSFDWVRRSIWVVCACTAIATPSRVRSTRLKKFRFDTHQPDIGILERGRVKSRTNANEALFVVATPAMSIWGLRRNGQIGDNERS
jgi:hypothetical protein